MKNKRFIIIVISVLALLLIPLVAMQFTDDVNWSALDFIVMGILLLGLGTSVEFILRKIPKTTTRLLSITAAVLIFLLVWAQLAVGIF